MCFILSTHNSFYTYIFVCILWWLRGVRFWTTCVDSISSAKSPTTYIISPLYIHVQSIRKTAEVCIHSVCYIYTRTTWTGTMWDVIIISSYVLVPCLFLFFFFFFFVFFFLSFLELLQWRELMLFGVVYVHREIYQLDDRLNQLDWWF